MGTGRPEHMFARSFGKQAELERLKAIAEENERHRKKLQEIDNHEFYILTTTKQNLSNTTKPHPKGGYYADHWEQEYLGCRASEFLRANKAEVYDDFMYSTYINLRIEGFSDEEAMKQSIDEPTFHKTSTAM